MKGELVHQVLNSSFHFNPRGEINSMFLFNLGANKLTIINSVWSVGIVQRFKNMFDNKEKDEEELRLWGTPHNHSFAMHLLFLLLLHHHIHHHHL